MARTGDLILCQEVAIGSSSVVVVLDRTCHSGDSMGHPIEPQRYNDWRRIESESISLVGLLKRNAAGRVIVSSASAATRLGERSITCSTVQKIQRLVRNQSRLVR